MRIERTILHTLIALLALTATASAQSAFSKSTLNSQVAADFPDQNTGAITPAIQRTFLNNAIASWQNAPVINAQVGASYAFVAADYGGLVTFNNGGAVAVTLSAPGVAGFNPWNVMVQNQGAGLVTITPSGATINGNATFTLRQNQNALIVSDSVNYQVWLALTPVAGGGTGLTSGTSGGVPYFNSTTTMASSAALATNGIVVGGGAGNPPASGVCTEDANGSITCSSSVSSTPHYTLQNTTSDNTSPASIFSKNRSGGNTNSGDVLGQYLINGFANGAQRTAAAINFNQSASSSGSNIPTNIQLMTSNAAGLTNQDLQFDQNAHLAVVTQATAPTITAGCNGAGSSVGAGSSDLHGWVTGQTAAVTTCTITFGTAFTNRPACVASGENSPLTGVITVGTGTLVVNFASTGNFKFDWICMGS